ncbi:MAG TPA: DCC1-like thiol-disulfide oxidoreductase family protein [Oligoflexus sp.]|uniref:thiol-disulfide oxidoreductase DCC family protein n=1 Tax=Oligoflexus sp. TaxID=1971216 RepID=UPI002D3C4D44|nr:DCC1-like thiol-disulfide oxidoreductase family protein [Oligoflexus sp.]HYX34751.1 DCC1-like thiol-disulfide oxidoreductase family protein [Oligoflexus sp.]
MNKKFVFFDAECLVCNRFARFLLQHSDLYLAPLGGATWRSLPLPPEIHTVDSVVFWNGQRAFIRVEAVRAIAQHMGGIWRVLALPSYLLPISLQNFFYDRFARVRIRWFGRVGSCALIPPQDRTRLVQD